MIAEYVKNSYYERVLEEEWPISPQEQQAYLSKIGVQVAEPYRGNEKVMEQLNEILNAIVSGPIKDPKKFKEKVEAAMTINHICEIYEHMFANTEGRF